MLIDNDEHDTRMCLLTESSILIVLHHNHWHIKCLTDAVPPRLPPSLKFEAGFGNRKFKM